MLSRSRSAARFAAISLALAPLGCGAEAPDPRPVGPAGTGASAPSAAPLQELEALYARSVERILAGMPDDERLRALAFFEERHEDPYVLRLRFTAAGTPKELHVPGLRVAPEDLGLPPDTGPEALADAFVRRFAPLWQVDGAVIDEAEVVSAARGDRLEVEYRQRHQGLAVVGGGVRVTVSPDEPPAVVGIAGSFLAVGEDLGVVPALPPEEAERAVALEEGESVRAARLVIWAPYREGREGEASLAWRVPVQGGPGGLVRRAYVDAHGGAVLADEPVARHAKRRAVWDLRTEPGFADSSCMKWQTSVTAWPAELAGCPASCSACSVDPRDCAVCACADPGWDPPDCASKITLHDEASACSGCDAEASMLWSDAGRAYDYWSASFGRDSWDGAGAWVHTKVNPDDAVVFYAGIAQPEDVDDDGDFDVAHATIRDGSANAFLDGHELGHVLQFGTESWDGLSFHAQGVAAMEHNADVHGHHYQGIGLGAGYDCAPADFVHYTDYRSVDDNGQTNKYIGDCQGWLMSQPGPPVSHFGVAVTPTSRATYDQIWYRALDQRFGTSHDYFDWWNDLVGAAADLYGFGAPYTTAVNARDAVGGWTGFASPSGITAVAPNERYAATGWVGAPAGPCVFYRGPTSPAPSIIWRCLSGGSWTLGAVLNDPAVDPAASEPAAAYRYESGTTYAYVFWRGTADRIHYRRFDVGTFAVGPAQDLGPSHLTSGPPAIASVWESGSLDRLVVVYHPLAQPTWFHWTYLGSASPPVDLGPTFDSDVPPSMVAYPYYSRLYFVRADAAGGATPRRIRYASYTVPGGWTALTDMTAQFNPPHETNLPLDILRTDRGVALAEYGRSATKRLRMTFVTLGDAGGAGRELWYATLRETSPGLLSREEYRAVPLAPLNDASSRSAGGLAVTPAGYPLIHAWGQGSSISPKLAEWRTHSD